MLVKLFPMLWATFSAPSDVRDILNPILLSLLSRECGHVHKTTKQGALRSFPLFPSFCFSLFLRAPPPLSVPLSSVSLFSICFAVSPHFRFSPLLLCVFIPPPPPLTLRAAPPSFLLFSSHVALSVLSFFSVSRSVSPFHPPLPHTSLSYSLSPHCPPSQPG